MGTGLASTDRGEGGLRADERRETLARMTYQRLFRRYIRLSGMTGTASEVARESNRLPARGCAHSAAQTVAAYLRARLCVRDAGAKMDTIAISWSVLRLQKGVRC